MGVAQVGAGDAFRECLSHPGVCTMIRRAALATALVVFVHTGAALLLAGPPARRPATPTPPAPKRYLNPLGLALSADGLRAYVALSGVDALAEVDLVTGRTLRRFETGRNPREVRRDGDTLTVTDDGPGTLLLSLSVGRPQRVDKASDIPTRLSQPTEVEIPVSSKADGPNRILLTIDHEPAWAPIYGGVTEEVFENTLSANFFRDFGNTGAALSPAVGFGGTGGFSGVLGFAGGSLGYFGALGFTGGNGGWNGTGPLSKRAFGLSLMLNTDGRGSFLTAPLDRTKAAAQPSAIVWDRPFNVVFVAAAGSDTILALSLNGLHSNLKAAAVQAAFTPADAETPLGSLLRGEARPPVGLVRLRLPTQSNPRRLALSDDGRVLVASNTLSDSLTVIAVGPAGARVIGHIPLGGPEPDAVRRGEVLFHSARLSFNGRFACSSCHPGGGSDGRAWLTPTEDPDFIRQTKPLFGVRDTAPYGWHGDSATLADRVQKTLTKLHKHSPKQSEVRDLVAYLESLDPPAPVPAAADQAAAVAHGRELFEVWAKCARCHAGDRLSDGQRHDVGTGGLFDTPSLRGVGRRSPLLHTGQAFGPADIFLNHNAEHRHGAAHELNSSELGDLMAYLKTL
jgi:mono/diheme cytochrome c family protein